MKNGLDRFEYYLVKLEDLLLQASAERNPGLWLYSNDARTPIFMLEGLSKLYTGLHNKKRFTRLKEDFKLLEDALGAIDYYDCFAKEFVTKSNIPAGVTDYVQGQAREKIQHLNDLLTQRKWIGEDAVRVIKMRKKLASADWMKDDKEVKAIAAFYKGSIKEIKNFIGETDCKFTEIETQVHAIRRKLRWLSIYPRALQGLIQLTENNVIDDSLHKYLTPETTNSAFNIMPEAGNNRYFLMLEKNYFLALSWMIASLGKLKDNGLRIVVITEALQQVTGIDHDAALAKTYEILGSQHPGLSSILSDASAMCGIYFKEQNLDRLLSGIAAIS
ncbi:MAG: hypothetical protein ABI741_13740 [Ferruginibacter sp.]